MNCSESEFFEKAIDEMLNSLPNIAESSGWEKAAAGASVRGQIAMCMLLRDAASSLEKIANPILPPNYPLLDSPG